MKAKKVLKVIKQILVVKNQDQEDQLKTTLFEGTKVLSFINAHAVNLLFKNANFLHSINDSSIVLRDGIGVKILFKLLKLDAGLNMNGTDFIPKLVLACKENIALYGTNHETVSLVREILKNKGLNVVSAHHGFEAFEYYVEEIKLKKPRLVLLGMGMPKQEILSKKIKDEIDFKCLIINGGAILDFMSGNVKRAPIWMRKLGLEWFYRFLSEPKRLFKRYFIGNFMFFVNARKILNAQE